jgi:hypothetical protein
VTRRPSTRLVFVQAVLVCLGLAFVLRAWGSAAADGNTVNATRVGTRAEARQPEAVEVRSYLTQEWGVAHPTGLAYLPAESFLLVAGAAGRDTEVLRLSPQEEASVDTLRLPHISSPATLALDRAGGRLTALSGHELLSVPAQGLRKERPPVHRINVAHLGLQVPTGATFDPASGTWFVLDNGARAIVRVPMQRGTPATPTRISLGGLGGARLQGLALHPGDGLFYGIGTSGEVHKSYGLGAIELGGPGLRDLRALLFAPSSDPTDAPATRHLFIADAGDSSTFGGVAEVALVGAP